ncbi:MAG TPA: HdeD family acid-resistance protein [Aliiroseovarius sp.]|nr:HdeD family acid-resistance protein [Aliiroseovarius sp.]
MTETLTKNEGAPFATITSILKPRWGWIVASGIVTALFGLLAFRIPVGAVYAMTLLFGAYAMADGILSIIAAIRGKGTDADNFWPLLLRGALGVFAGIIVLVMPGLSAVSLTAFAWAMIAIWSITSGLFEIVAAIRLRAEIEGEWLLGLAGLVSLVLGIAIPVVLLSNPGAGIVTMGWMIGFYALLHGILEIGLGLMLRKLPDAG